MKIQCPKCGISKQVDDSKIPDKGCYARCPKCNHRFFIKKIKNFREKKESPSFEKNISCPKCGSDSLIPINADIGVSSLKNNQAKNKEKQKAEQIQQEQGRTEKSSHILLKKQIYQKSKGKASPNKRVCAILIDFMIVRVSDSFLEYVCGINSTVFQLIFFLLSWIIHKLSRKPLILLINKTIQKN